ncbi:uncharacterized protein L969DRAFT_104736 [Mixia osmundae IAM 14324]|uniref:Major facilitator superfamily (MFS) profile domain-containing protein n=1 Tax=Mixia osmundae (strain CBS 9802 / IAM 14324 / JCM 22182 / KY 12970) TaxID=764103 RepID=G7DWU8_MIXOS|nr:uncharacterized protein L969DRAFT_68132 [Mixia osmundae IAM 14324]XP_014566709.1 uncharacterized protein L969DRAFT_104736 [Mixia osmundae IAM 14324]KEI36178.1 hypothetical protein L969DRAFT_68132 [Mixia osmundae IAM 14324]KEI38146.1 hypothetical protein L969DRAFT_104736 [Mixia osmundae IAM 14324]GAA95045.1 hypothetical protein E5Q_01700 [Mixia osmundae IAM 14324]
MSTNKGNAAKETRQSSDNSDRTLAETKEDKDPFLVSFADDDPESPLSWPAWKRWSIVLIISMGATCVTCASSMVASTYTAVEPEFGISEEVATLSLSLFVWGLGISPLFLAPLSETYGRRPIYLISFALFLLFNIPVAAAHNAATWLVGRTLTGLFAAPFLSVAGGSVTDMFSGPKTGRPMAIFTASPFIGPAAGPILADAINAHQNWRVTWYFMLAWAGLQFAALVFFVPETYAPALLVKKAARLRKQTGDDRYQAPLDRQEGSIIKEVFISCARPFQLLAYEPMCALLCSWTALLLAILYVFFSAYNIVYMDVHGFTLQETGFTFFGLLLGVILGTATSPIFETLYRRSAQRLGHQPPPEIHLRKGMVGGPLLTISLFIFAVTTHAHPAISIVFSVPFGAGVVLVFSSVFTYLTDAYRPYAASALASNSATRSALAGALPLVSNQMYHRLGTIGATCLLAGLTALAVPLPFIFSRYGARIRKNSRFS